MIYNQEPASETAGKFKVAGLEGQAEGEKAVNAVLSCCCLSASSCWEVRSWWKPRSQPRGLLSTSREGGGHQGTRGGLCCMWTRQPPGAGAAGAKRYFYNFFKGPIQIPPLILNLPFQKKNGILCAISMAMCFCLLPCSYGWSGTESADRLE